MDPLRNDCARTYPVIARNGVHDGSSYKALCRPPASGESAMSDPISRRTFAPLAAGLALGATGEASADDKPKPPGPTEAAFERDYPAPGFQPSWKKPQLNRLLVQDFVVYAHN